MQVLAIVRRRTEAFSGEQFAPMLEPEAQSIRTLYAQGSVRSVWNREDTPGAAVLLAMAHVEQLIALKGYRGFGPRA